MRVLTIAMVGLSVLVLVAPPLEASHPWFNGVSSWYPANQWDAPIFRQFAFVEGTVVMYHVLTPDTFLMDNHKSYIYQFPDCVTLRPVLQKHYPQPGDGGFWGDHDAPTRNIVDVVLTTGCTQQPKSEAEVLQLAAPNGVVVRNVFVNAPVIPPQLADLPDDRLYNGPPWRPRVTAWQEGVQVKFITYEASWLPSWVDTNFGGPDADVFIISYGAMFRHDFTIINVAAGTPHHWSTDAYSPIWKANCIVDAVNQKCMVSVHQGIPGYYQCKSIAECLAMKNELTGLQVLKKETNTFTHINCPMVAVDLDGGWTPPVTVGTKQVPAMEWKESLYISAWEELVFPNFWVNGPVVL